MICIDAFGNIFNSPLCSSGTCKDAYITFSSFVRNIQKLDIDLCLYSILLIIDTRFLFCGNTALPTVLMYIF